MEFRQVVEPEAALDFAALLCKESLLLWGKDYLSAVGTTEFISAAPTGLGL